WGSLTTCYIIFWAGVSVYFYLIYRCCFSDPVYSMTRAYRRQHKAKCLKLLLIYSLTSIFCFCPLLLFLLARSFLAVESFFSLRNYLMELSLQPSGRRSSRISNSVILET